MLPPDFAPQRADRLKAFLDEWAERINVPAYIDTDPVQFPHRYASLHDREVVAFLTAVITWGNRRSILASANRMLEPMGRSPYDYIRSGGFLRYPPGNIHRTFFSDDLAYWCRGLRPLYERDPSLENLFLRSESPWDGILALREGLVVANGGLTSKHVSNPSANSACKRLHLALRWLVRTDGIVDLGCWTRMSPADLQMPLDVHVGRISRALGLLGRRQDDRKAVEELTGVLKGFCPDDPVRYDYALFGIGEAGVVLPDDLR